MAKYGSKDVKVEFGVGPTDISADILDIPGVDKQAETEESHGFGKEWVEHLATGLHRIADITLRGFYDDTATTGTNALFNRIGETDTLLITWGGTSPIMATSIPVLIKNYRRLPTRGELTKFEVVLLATGEPTENPA